MQHRGETIMGFKDMDEQAKQFDRETERQKKEMEVPADPGEHIKPPSPQQTAHIKPANKDQTKHLK
jgi:hypothetical protein